MEGQGTSIFAKNVSSKGQKNAEAVYPRLDDPICKCGPEKFNFITFGSIFSLAKWSKLEIIIIYITISNFTSICTSVGRRHLVPLQIFITLVATKALQRYPLSLPRRS